MAKQLTATMRGRSARRGASKMLRRQNRKAAFKLRRKSNVKNRTNVSVGKGFPKKMTMTHKYCEQLLLATGAGGILNTYNWRANGMYDPNATGLGHQPMYFDQMSTLYDHYTVIGSKITIKVIKADTITIPTTIGIFVNDDATVTPTTNGLLENSLATHKVLVGQNSGGACFLTRKWSAKKYFGGSVLANVNLSGTPSNDPAEQSIFTVFIDSTPVATASSVLLDVTIEYIAVWTELKDIATS